MQAPGGGGRAGKLSSAEGANVGDPSSAEGANAGNPSIELEKILVTFENLGRSSRPKTMKIGCENKVSIPKFFFRIFGHFRYSNRNKIGSHKSHDHCAITSCDRHPK